MPEFAHIPLVNYNSEEDEQAEPAAAVGGRRSAALKACGWTDEEIKGRDDLNIATVAYYREIGYLPEALINYLVPPRLVAWMATSEFIPLRQADRELRVSSA